MENGGNQTNIPDTNSTPDTTPVIPPSLGQPTPKTHAKWWIIIGVIAAVFAIALGVLLFLKSKPADTTKTAGSAPKFHIGLSLDTYKELRWQKDRDLMVSHAKDLGGAVTTLVADSDDDRQVAQIENLIAQKVDVLIIVAHSADAVASTVAEAHKAGIKVIAYDRLITNSDLDMYVTFDSTILGKYEAQYVMDAVPSTVKTANVALVGGASTDNNSILVKNGAMSVLDPLVKSGKAKIVYDQYTTDWSADVAYTNIKDFLDKGGTLDAVVAANDGTAGGVIKALKTHGLDGKIPVSGSDAELPAVQRVAAGTQTMTIYTPFKNLANKAVDIAYAFVQKKTPVTNGAINNGKKDVPSFLLDSTPVTKQNITDTLVKDKVYSNQDIFGTTTH